MVLQEADQRGWKRSLVEEALARIGKLRGITVEDCVPSERSLAYRNKVEFTLSSRGGSRVVGFHEAGSPNGRVDVDRCLLQGDTANEVLSSARRFFLEGAGKNDPALENGRDALRLVIRHSRLDGRVLVALRGPSGPFPSAAEFARILVERHREIAGVVRIFAQPGRRGGTRTIVLAGTPWIDESLAGIRYRLPAGSFFQVNTDGAEQLVRLVLECSAPPPGQSALDLYGGVGAFGLALARRGCSVTVVEADREAIEAGRSAARDAGLVGIRFVRSGVGVFLRDGVRRGERAALVVADPPRTGLEKGVAGHIADLEPARVVLVACDPATMARDASLLVARGYAVRRVVPVDLFPQTAHVEAVVLLERTNAPRG